ncbi:uncharacterized protein PV09_03997 [Verruconis gallopava]|uniref:DUF1993 domain-containing protein n=1 Tax=Verruconis gallopava TaxID=253628 RepID=A0A0D1YVT8_9PEZI|nr:uncharacterized protein PV09_03997 [Verruconis gallopava]KIW04812.1 hypothetical protein PV09_03997 [Verruconis gallopava]
MTSYNLYDGTVVYFAGGMRALAHILSKAEQHCKENNIPEKEFMEASLAPDMKPLTFQIQTASDTSRKAVSRLTGSQLTSIPDTESTFAELQARIAKTQEVLEATKKEDWNFDIAEEITVPLGPREMTFTKKSYAEGFAVPNFYFHVVTAYAILRMKGVNIGKADYLRPIMGVPA